MHQPVGRCLCVFMCVDIRAHVREIKERRGEYVFAAFVPVEFVISLCV